VDAVEDFARRLRRLRQALGWTMYRLAKDSGLTWEGVSKLESPGCDPKLSTLFKLAAALGIEARELLPEGPPVAKPAKGTAGPRNRRGKRRR
jgi:transcriptional regulator with XRE-family HTH domain